MSSDNPHHDKTFPGETPEYREQRNALLDAEKELRRKISDVAALRQALPRGGQIPEDYIFEERMGGATRKVTLSQLFEGAKTDLVVYGFMYGTDWEKPCPSCNSIVDGLNGAAPHLNDRINLVIVAKAPIDKLMAWADKRGWSNLRLLSAAPNTFNADYHAERADGFQIPALNVFEKTDDGIFHTYNSELLYSSSEDGQEPRHVDSIWPIWNVLDLTRGGRGTDWEPALEYEAP